MSRTGVVSFAVMTFLVITSLTLQPRDFKYSFARVSLLFPENISNHQER